MATSEGSDRQKGILLTTDSLSIKDYEPAAESLYSILSDAEE